jgi:hypothetical protein
MKKIIFLICILILTFPTVNAAKSVFDIMDNVDDFYYLVLTQEAVGGDTAAATKIALSFLTNKDLKINTVIEGEISENLPRILIGPQCGSEYLENLFDFSCEEWPYEEGQALIKVDGNNLIITGTTSNDRRRAGIILSNYEDYNIFKENSFVLVTGTTLEPAEINLTKAKAKTEFICGDGICDPGEAYLCNPDCNKNTCFDICNEEGYTEAFCRDIPTNPNLEICEDSEINKGMKYCTNSKSCCCKLIKQEIKNVTTNLSKTPDLIKEDQSFWSKILTKENPLIIAISISFVVIVLVLIFAYFFIIK